MLHKSVLLHEWHHKGDRMKKEVNFLLVLAIAAVILVVTVALVFIFGNDRVNYDNLTEVKILRSGTMIPSGEEYGLKFQDGVWIATYNEIEWLEDNIKEMTVDDGFADEIRTILAKNKTHKWDDFHKKNAFISDGERFTFSMRFSDGTQIEASGYMAYPKHFFAVFEAFQEKYTQMFK